jgi:hypothetical protein
MPAGSQVLENEISRKNFYDGCNLLKIVLSLNKKAEMEGRVFCR